MPEPQPNRRAVVAAGAALAALPAHATVAGDPVIELRQYTCHPGGRNRLNELFARAFIEPQEAVGARVLGTFRDRDDPDRFVWLRGFGTYAARAEALTAFYGGPVWKAHRDAANSTMLDSDNVLLLRPTDGSTLRPLPSAPRGILAFIHYLDDGLMAPFAEFFARVMRPQIEADGGEMLATLMSETRENNFPRLPVRSHERVFVWIVRPTAGETSFLLRRHARSGWRETAGEALLPALMRKPELLRLEASA
ncbi:NIPSNAP family protein [Phenylobacterium sp.]|uniref:NIPSNAP family protein n=1 Tax=Phenylobacterium sp. TaxID=1871053 RepID=UPI0025DABA14|nr:NIPSNAP family protein [Phenylobacterium sp.]